MPIFDPAAAASGGGGGTPGGTPGQVQYNDAGSFGGFGDWDGLTLTLPGELLIATPDSDTQTPLTIPRSTGDVVFTGGYLPGLSDWVFTTAAGVGGAAQLIMDFAVSATPNQGYISFAVSEDGVGQAAMGFQDSAGFGATSLARIPTLWWLFDSNYALVQLIDTHLLGLFGSDDQATPADLLVSGLAGVGTGYVCADANGKLVRSAIACV